VQIGPAPGEKAKRACPKREKEMDRASRAFRKAKIEMEGKNRKLPEGMRTPVLKGELERQAECRGQTKTGNIGKSTWRRNRRRNKAEHRKLKKTKTRDSQGSGKKAIGGAAKGKITCRVKIETP